MPEPWNPRGYSPMATDLHERIKFAIEQRLALAERTRGQWSGVWRWEEGFGDKCNDPTCEYGTLIDEDGDPYGGDGVLVLMSVHGYETRWDWQGAAHIAANDPAFVIRSCRADLERLNEHAPKRTAMETWWPQLDGLLVDWLCAGHGLLLGKPWPCTEVLRLAAVYAIEVTDE